MSRNYRINAENYTAKPFATPSIAALTPYQVNFANMIILLKKEEAESAEYLNHIPVRPDMIRKNYTAGSFLFRYEKNKPILWILQ